MKSLHLIPTEDGTPSLYSDEYGQAMHTHSGAYTEALVKHVRPSGILARDEGALRVLDVGFGIGYNTLALLSEFRRDGRGQRLEIVTLEKDLPPVEIMESISFQGEMGALYGMLKKLNGHSEVREDNFTVRMLTGDARKTVRDLIASRYHAIFHDPYSPAKNPELWTVEFFRELYRVADDGCTLTTYSGALQVRAALMEAGFVIGRGPAMGHKREGTLATKGARLEPLDEMARGELQSSVKATPYRDKTLAAGREEILNRRKDEMAARRKS
ncbi:MAG TPA: MnmC family methyltransferase [Spirochaetota bacterium]|nr:MnmC family methyltransferase [Spirochaetota bacterium]